jgi:hypothetical protein
MLSHEEIERRKARLRQDPQTARICRALGVTVERFLADIELTAAHPVLHDNQPPGREEERRASILSVARRVAGSLRRTREQKAGRHDGVVPATALTQETSTRRLLGADE